MLLIIIRLGTGQIKNFSLRFFIYVTTIGYSCRLNYLSLRKRGILLLSGLLMGPLIAATTYWEVIYGGHYLLVQKWRKKVVMPLTRGRETLVGPNVSGIPELTPTVPFLSGMSVPDLQYTLP